MNENLRKFVDITGISVILLRYNIFCAIVLSECIKGCDSNGFAG